MVSRIGEWTSLSRSAKKLAIEGAIRARLQEIRDRRLALDGWIRHQLGSAIFACHAGQYEVAANCVALASVNSSEVDPRARLIEVPLEEITIEYLERALDAVAREPARDYPVFR